MIKWFKKQQETAEVITIKEEKQETFHEKTGFYARLKQSLNKTKQQLGNGIGRILLGKKIIDTQLFDALETLLISADLGINTTQKIMNELTEGLARKQLCDGDAIYEALKNRLESMLVECAQPLVVFPEKMPFVILTVGVNGAGKTTTIGKMAKLFQAQGKKVMLAAGDTFRAAAIEQLKVWGERNQVPIIAQHTGADSASVIFDAMQAAKSRNIDVLIADTAGRLHTQSNLMEELKKVKRVIQKLDPEAPHEVMLILDASIGQNALTQAREFHQAIGLTGITMTKLDGTARGGLLFAIADELHIPFRYIGIGEKIDDLRDFNASHFVRALFE